MLTSFKPRRPHSPHTAAHSSRGELVRRLVSRAQDQVARVFFARRLAVHRAAAGLTPEPLVRLPRGLVITPGAPLVVYGHPPQAPAPESISDAEIAAAVDECLAILGPPPVRQAN